MAATTNKQNKPVSMTYETLTEIRIGDYLFYSRFENHPNVWRGVALIRELQDPTTRQVIGKVLKAGNPELERTWAFQSNNVIRAYGRERLERKYWPDPKSDTAYEILILEYLERIKHPFSDSLGTHSPSNRASYRFKDSKRPLVVLLDPFGNSYATNPISNEIEIHSKSGTYMITSSQIKRNRMTGYQFLHGLAEAIATIHRTLESTFPNHDNSFHAHGDLNPRNILLRTRADDDLDVIVIDLAQLQPGEYHPAWASPEHFRNEIIPASDVYILGLYAMRIYHSLPYLKRRLAPDLRKLALRCMHPDPHARPTAGDLLVNHLGPIVRPNRWQRHRFSLFSTLILAILLGIALWKLFFFDPSYRGRFGDDNGAEYFDTLVDAVRLDRDAYYSSSASLLEIIHSGEAWPELRFNAIRARAQVWQERFPYEYAPFNPIEIVQPFAILAPREKGEIYIFYRHETFQLGDWLDKDHYFAGVNLGLNSGIDHLFLGTFANPEAFDIEVYPEFKWRHNRSFTYSLSLYNLPFQQLLQFVAEKTGRQVIIYGDTNLELRGFVAFNTHEDLLETLASCLPPLVYDKDVVIMNFCDWTHYTFFTIGVWQTLREPREIGYVIKTIASRLGFSVEIPEHVSKTQIRQLTVDQAWEDAITHILESLNPSYCWKLEKRQQMTLVIEACQ